MADADFLNARYIMDGNKVGMSNQDFHPMYKQANQIESIRAIIGGPPSESVSIFVHGKMSQKEEAEGCAKIAIKKAISKYWKMVTTTSTTRNK